MLRVLELYKTTLQTCFVHEFQFLFARIIVECDNKHARIAREL